MEDQKLERPTRESVIKFYDLNEREQVYLADELLKIELLFYNSRKILI